MIANSNETNYLRFDEGDNSFSILKSSISRPSVNVEKNHILIPHDGTGTGPVRTKLDFDSVSSPVTANVMALYDVIMGYL